MSPILFSKSVASIIRKYNNPARIFILLSPEWAFLNFQSNWLNHVPNVLKKLRLLFSIYHFCLRMLRRKTKKKSWFDKLTVLEFLFLRQLRTKNTLPRLGEKKSSKLLVLARLLRFCVFTQLSHRRTISKDTASKEKNKGLRFFGAYFPTSFYVLKIVRTISADQISTKTTMVPSIKNERKGSFTKHASSLLTILHPMRFIHFSLDSYKFTDILRK